MTSSTRPRSKRTRSCRGCTGPQGTNRPRGFRRTILEKEQRRPRFHSELKRRRAVGLETVPPDSCQLLGLSRTNRDVAQEACWLISNLDPARRRSLARMDRAAVLALARARVGVERLIERR